MAALGESRNKERYIALQPFSGSFVGIPICVCDMGQTGVQIEHYDPLRIATSGRLAFSGVGSQIVELRGIIIWSLLSIHPDISGKFLYHSGVKVEDQEIELDSTIDKLLSRGLIRRDEIAPERKRDRLVSVAPDDSRMTIKRTLAAVTEGPTNDQLLLIRHARERLSAHPKEAARLYNEATFAFSSNEPMALGEIGVDQKEDILAVWEYLERSMELPTVVRAFQVK